MIIPPLTFNPDLIDAGNLPVVVDSLKAAFFGKEHLALKLVRWDGTFNVRNNFDFVPDSDKAIQFKLAPERNHKTTSHYLGLVFRDFAYHFYTSDDILIEWYSPTVVVITNQKQPREDKEGIKSLVLSVNT